MKIAQTSFAPVCLYKDERTILPGDSDLNVQVRNRQNENKVMNSGYIQVANLIK